MESVTAVIQGPMWNAVVAPCLAEFWGAFYLVLTICLSTTWKDDDLQLNPNIASKAVLAPLAIGTVLGLCIFATGPVSGGHLNPAVTLGVFLRGKVSIKNMCLYIPVQIIGAMVAGVIGVAIQDTEIYPKPGPGYTVGQAMLMEILFTMLLVGTVLFVATSKSSENNDYFGYAIGMVVFVGAVCCGPISGAAFNPAVTIGLVFGTACIKEPPSEDFEDMWIGIFGPFIGAIFAAGYFRLTSAREFGTRKSGIVPQKANQVMQQPKDLYKLLNKEAERSGVADENLHKKIDRLLIIMQGHSGSQPGGGVGDEYDEEAALIVEQEEE